MMHLVLAVLLMQVKAVVPDVGDIWIRTGPGVVVTLDGVRKGVTTEEEAGLRLLGVKVGRHEVTLSVPSGGSKTVVVNVQREQTSTVNVPIIGLMLRGEKAAKGAVELEVVQPSASCTAMLGTRRYEVEREFMRTEDVDAGKYLLAVTCGDRSVRKEVTIPADRVLVVRVDPSRRQITVLGDRPRVLTVEVEKSTDKIERAPIPANVKRALLSVIPQQNIEVIRFSVDASGLVTMIVDVTDEWQAANLGYALTSLPEIQIYEVRTQMMSPVRARLEVSFFITR